MIYSPWVYQSSTYKHDPFQDSKGYNWSCVRVLREYFKFPAEVQMIRFYVTPQPTGKTYDYTCLSDIYQAVEIQGVEMAVYVPLYKFLKRAQQSGKKMYFGVEYL